MKSRTIFSLLILVACLGVLLGHGNAETRDDQQAIRNAQIQKLLVERRETFRQQLPVLNALLVGGSRDLDVERITHAQNGLLESELELAANKTDRIKAHQERLESTRLLEEILEQRLIAGLEDRDRFFTAKAARLQAEIELLREQNRTN